MLTRQSWTDFILGYYICQSCWFVDRDDERIRVGYPCGRCGVPSPGGFTYFDITVGAIADLIAEFYPLPDPTLHTPLNNTEPPRESHSLAILVFFCTLGEILLQHFLECCMLNLNIALNVRKRLFDDNFFKQRLDNLFPSLVGVSWKNAVKAAAKNSHAEFQSAVDFYIVASKRRNKLLHLGEKWDMPPDMAKRCFDNMVPLIRLFIELNNTYLAKPIPLAH